MTARKGGSGSAGGFGGIGRFRSTGLAHGARRFQGTSRFEGKRHFEGMRHLEETARFGRAARFATASAVVCLMCSALLGSAASGRVERDRPPPAHTGGFSEPLCTACHFQADVNDGPGTLTIEGLPAAYDPGTAYTLTITIAQEYLAAGGFQMAARFEDGAQAGTLAAAPSDSARVDVTTHDGVQYIHHTYDGTPAVAPDTARWRVIWTAPREGKIVLHVAANAADDDFSPMGDMIYAASMRTSPAGSAKQQQP